ncbi:MAG TPA: hypothetical protein VN939_06160 [Chthoniobacterales bacterium]|jgi:hypothetical protein|nr:hypothetical protein [Chthoniobacterales bacterium]
MNEAVNPDETIGPEQGRRFCRILPSMPRSRSFRRLLRMGANWFGRLLQVGANWFGILRKLLAFSGVGLGCMPRGNWAGYTPGIPHFYYRVLPIVISSGLKAIFLTN